MEQNIYKDKFSEKLNYLIEHDKWNAAKDLLESEIKKHPNEYFLITSLSKVYYNLGQYKNALELSSMALDIEKRDPLVIYDHACALFSNKRYNLAIKYWDSILKMNPDEIAYGEFGEGKNWATSIINDSRYRLAIGYLKLDKKSQAKKLIDEHLKNRRRGLYSDFSKSEVVSMLLSLS